jgi:hypothetical protein
MSGVLQQPRPADATEEPATGEAKTENVENVATPTTPKSFEVLTVEDNERVYLKGWRLYITILGYAASTKP